MATINQKVMIPAEPDEVYDAYMNSEKHSTFTGSAAEIDAKVGGEFIAWDGYIMGRNLALEKGKKIVQEWRTTEWPENTPSSRLEILLKKVKEGTELTLNHTDVPDDQAEDYRKGWINFYWDPLKKYFA
jgi:activator of HSP90 ATPase